MYLICQFVKMDKWCFLTRNHWDFMPIYQFSTYFKFSGLIDLFVICEGQRHSGLLLVQPRRHITQHNGRALRVQRGWVRQPLPSVRGGRALLRRGAWRRHVPKYNAYWHCCLWGSFGKPDLKLNTKILSVIPTVTEGANWIFHLFVVLIKW